MDQTEQNGKQKLLKNVKNNRPTGKNKIEKTSKAQYKLRDFRYRF